MALPKLRATAYVTSAIVTLIAKSAVADSLPDPTGFLQATTVESGFLTGNKSVTGFGGINIGDLSTNAQAAASPATTQLPPFFPTQRLTRFRSLTPR